MDGGGQARGPVDRFIGLIEVTAAGFLAVVTALTFVSVILRYFFSWAIPDSYDLTRLFLGIVIFWGMAVASFRGDHITVDLLWSAMPPPLQRVIDSFASVVTLIGLAAFTWMFWTKVIGTRADNVETFDLREPVWIYYLIAWIGLAAAVVLLILRTLRLLLWPDKVGAGATHAIE
jgi:TRAP-type C4-dicarboxylate transport system permease small subunit